MEGDIGDMIAKWIKASELIVNSIGYPPQWPIGDDINPGDKLERYFF
jgi:hypothetical protein